MAAPLCVSSYMCVSLSAHRQISDFFFFFKFVRSFSFSLLCVSLSVSFPESKKKIYLSLYPLTLSGWVRVLHRRLLAWSSRGKCSSFNPKTKQNKKLANRKQENLKVPFSYNFIDVVLLFVGNFGFFFSFLFLFCLVCRFFILLTSLCVFVRPQPQTHTRTLVPPLSLSRYLSDRLSPRLIIMVCVSSLTSFTNTKNNWYGKKLFCIIIYLILRFFDCWIIHLLRAIDF